MGRTPKYQCSECGGQPGRQQLTAVKVIFQMIGERGRVLRSRTIAWLCPLCLDENEFWHAEPFKGPGNQDDVTEDTEAPEGATEVRPNEESVAADLSPGVGDLSSVA